MRQFRVCMYVYGCCSCRLDGYKRLCVDALTITYHRQLWEMKMPETLFAVTLGG